MLARKVAVVTGAGSGIGRAVSVAFAKDGCCVVLAGRRRAGLEETAVAAEAAGARVLVYPADVTDKAAVTALFDATTARFGRLDILVNNAGIFTPGVPLEEVTVDQWRSAVDTNLSGSFYCAQEAFRVMKAQNPQGGRIINNGSISAEVPRPNAAAYTCTKHAITGLTKQCALDGRSFNIACGQIDIGNAATEITAPMRKGIKQADGSIQVEPMMDVEDAAQAVLYMARLPLSANVLRLTVMASGMPFVGRG